MRPKLAASPSQLAIQQNWAHRAVCLFVTKQHQVLLEFLCLELDRLRGRWCWKRSCDLFENISLQCLGVPCQAIAQHGNREVQTGIPRKERLIARGTSAVRHLSHSILIGDDKAKRVADLPAVVQDTLHFESFDPGRSK